MNNYLSDEDESLARHIALKLDDMQSIAWHRKMVRMRPRVFLLEKLALVLSKTDEEIETTRAQYYNHLVHKGPERT